MKEQISKKSKSLKLAIENYNTLKLFLDTYNRTKSLDNFIMYMQLHNSHASENVINKFNELVNAYNNGDIQPLLTCLYDHVLAADEHKEVLAKELKDLLN